MLKRRIVPSPGRPKSSKGAPALLLLVLLLRESLCFRSVPTVTTRERMIPFVCVPGARRSPTVLQALSKSGAKLMESSDDFRLNVLQASTTRPVMVFYTAPW